MQYLITDGSRQILTAIEAANPEGGGTIIYIERADRPELLYVGVDLHSDGTVVVGHWPDGEHWDRVVSTAGAPDMCGQFSPAHPAEPTYTRAQAIEALTRASTSLAYTGDPAVLDAFSQAVLDSLLPPEAKGVEAGWAVDVRGTQTLHTTPPAAAPAPKPTPEPVGQPELVPADIIVSVQNLLAYSWDKEQRDYDEQDAEGREHHIANDLSRIARHWGLGQA
ncbi:hypothetical protein [Streptomyces sp. PT19]|uniref:hypothetical protein n=1 Tax=Streptomyces sp. PT19 TaxID=3452239 RepID=UPI003F809578